MNLQEIDSITRTEFWKEFMGRIAMRHSHKVVALRKESALDEKAWLKHVRYQGELEALDFVINLPEELLKEAKGTLGE